MFLLINIGHPIVVFIWHDLHTHTHTHLVGVTVIYAGKHSVRLNARCASSTASLFAVVAIFCDRHETD